MTTAWTKKSKTALTAVMAGTMVLGMVPALGMVATEPVVSADAVALAAYATASAPEAAAVTAASLDVASSNGGATLTINLSEDSTTDYFVTATIVDTDGGTPVLDAGQILTANGSTLTVTLAASDNNWVTAAPSYAAGLYTKGVGTEWTYRSAKGSLNTITSSSTYEVYVSVYALSGAISTGTNIMSSTLAANSACILDNALLTSHLTGNAAAGFNATNDNDPATVANQ